MSANSKANLGKDRRKRDKLGRPNTGRPSSFNADVARKICDRLASGEVITRICDDPAMPSYPTVMRWLTDAEGNPERMAFRESFAQARARLLDRWAAEVVTISDEAQVGQKSMAEVTAARLRVDSRKWLLSKLRPERYGDASRLEVNVKERHVTRVILEDRTDVVDDDEDHAGLLADHGSPPPADSERL